MNLDISTAQAAEVAKYQTVYKVEEYRMGAARKACALDNLESFKHRNGYLDVGCGRGEMLDAASELGYAGVRGVEVVDYLSERADIEGASVGIAIR